MSSELNLVPDFEQQIFMLRKMLRKMLPLLNLIIPLHCSRVIDKVSQSIMVDKMYFSGFVV